MPDEIIPFGKLKGKPVYALADDKSYTEWLLTQSWFKEKHLNIYNIVINSFRQPDDTPEHNSMQIKFLDSNHALKLAYYLKPTLFDLSSFDINESLIRAIDSQYRYVDVIKSKIIESNKSKMLYISPPKFEHGYDVAYHVRYGVQIEISHQVSYNETRDIFKFNKSNSVYLKIEIKPTISDDFPSILRQIKASMPARSEDMRNVFINCLLVGSYTGVGATKEQFVQFFESQNYRVIFASDLSNVSLPNFEEEFILKE